MLNEEYRMPSRKTIMIDEDIEKKIRAIQSKMLKEKNQSISFSYVINQVLEEGLKKF
jgi:predicted CopG family antitoxin